MTKRQRLNRQKVLNKATELSRTAGWETLNLHELATHLDIKAPSLYNHIQGLEDLKLGVVLTIKRVLLDELKNATIGKSGSNATKAMARAYLSFARANPGHLSAIATSPDKEVEEEMQIDKEFLSLGMAVLSEFQLSEVEFVHALRSIRCLTHGFAVLESDNGFGVGVSPDDSFDWMIEKLIGTFGKV